MKKIGILTLYRDSCNYGGVLQAYALTKYLCDLGYDARQICYRLEPDTDEKRAERISLMSPAEKRAKIYNKIRYNIIERPFNKLYGIRHYSLLGKRRDAFKAFRDKIPHTEKTYDCKNIYETVNDFDAFICGSDQIWGTFSLCPAFLLEFVPDDKIKFSYAASIARSKLSQREKEELKRGIEALDAVSVREETSVSLLSGISDKKTELCLDPTFLLTEDKWRDAARPVVLPDGFFDGYVFCYFLGDDKNQRKTAAEFAREKGLKTVTLPHLLGEFRMCDVNFGDYKCYDADPAAFVYLVLHSKYVLTDSFHATVFSIMLKKQFFVFERRGHKHMSTRITSLLDTAECKERLISANIIAGNCLGVMLDSPDIDYCEPAERLDKMKEDSARFIINNLKGKN